MRRETRTFAMREAVGTARAWFIGRDTGVVTSMSNGRGGGAWVHLVRTTQQPSGQERANLTAMRAHLADHLGKKRGHPPGSLVHIGERMMDELKITLLAYNGEQCSSLEVKDAAELQRPARARQDPTLRRGLPRLSSGGRNRG